MVFFVFSNSELCLSRHLEKVVMVLCFLKGFFIACFVSLLPVVVPASFVYLFCLHQFHLSLIIFHLCIICPVLACVISPCIPWCQLSGHLCKSPSSVLYLFPSPVLFCSGTSPHVLSYYWIYVCWTFSRIYGFFSCLSATFCYFGIASTCSVSYQSYFLFTAAFEKHDVKLSIECFT